MSENTVARECSSCRKRLASYFRRHSGERLCGICLHRNLVREVKRSFSKISKKGFRLKIAIPVYSRKIVESIVLMRILSEVEMEFNSEVVGVVLDEELIECSPVLRKHCRDLVFTSLSGDLFEVSDIERAIANLAIRLDIVALPETLSDLLTQFLKNLVSRYEVMKPRVYSKFSDIEVLIPMYRVLKTDIIAYAHISGILKSLDCFNPAVEKVDILEKLTTQLSLKHSELVYRFLHSV
ncbi:MAG: hypothetical protein RMI56_06015 [Sulfolobales archaeon]|nr:hypothetical protein [Sulfolobales archaeon]MDW8083332.1 hypothetical protein [Sulfolobales archaeon]